MAAVKKPYHHGDLRQALLRAAEAELVENGVDGFTLRNCARRAGVSHAAPAHHFGNANGLLVALAVDGFSRLAAAMSGALSSAAPGRDQMVAVAGGYIDFALVSPAIFQLMFRLQGRADADPALRQAGQAAFAIVARAVDDYYAVENGMSHPEVATRVIGLWALSHGLADLAIANQFGAPADVGETVATVLDRLVGT